MKTITTILFNALAGAVQKLHVPVILICMFCAGASAQSNYLKGQIRDDKGNGLSNLRIDLQSCGISFLSGTEGYFGFATARQFDTLIIYFTNRDTVKRSVNTQEFNTLIIKSEKLLSTKTARKLSSLSLHAKNISPRSVYLANETYSATVENPFFSTDQFSLTSLALSYNRASYSNIRRFLNMKATVPGDAVRLEEILNYFSWTYDEPEAGETFRMRSSLTACPWNRDHQLLFLNVSSRKLELENLPPSHLVFLIDVSGSMNLPNRLPLLKSAFRVLVNNLRDKDTVTLVGYGGNTRLLLDGISGHEKEKITNVIDSLEPAGNTPGESGIRLAYRLAKKHFIKGGNNRVILATDGDFNVGIRSEEELEQLIIQQKQLGIYLTCLGVGMGDYKDSKIQALAQKGSGNFAYLDSYAEAEKVLYKEFFQTLYTVADNVTMDVRFNPDVVKEYRLLGYDNRLASLRDKSALIQGGEVGAGNSLLVVFELNMKSSLQAGLADVNIQFQDKEGVEKNFNYAATHELTAFNNAPEAYRFASALIMFGMKLKHTPCAKNIRWDQVLGIAKNSARTHNFSEQEFLQLIHQAKMIYRKERRFRLF
jgi:Ca-activated chloride channel family protein